MIWVTLNMPSAVEECRKPSGKCQGISHCLESGHPEYNKHNLSNLVTTFSMVYIRISQICTNIYTVYRKLQPRLMYGVNLQNILSLVSNFKSNLLTWLSIVCLVFRTSLLLTKLNNLIIVPFEQRLITKSGDDKLLYLFIRVHRIISSMTYSEAILPIFHKYGVNRMLKGLLSIV